jgi:hypothetical protein
MKSKWGISTKKKTKMASISGLSGSVAILKIFDLNLEQSILLLVGYQFSHYVIPFWEIRKFLRAT